MSQINNVPSASSSTLYKNQGTFTNTADALIDSFTLPTSLTAKDALIITTSVTAGAATCTIALRVDGVTAGSNSFGATSGANNTAILVLNQDPATNTIPRYVGQNTAAGLIGDSGATVTANWITLGKVVGLYGKNASAATGSYRWTITKA